MLIALRALLVFNRLVPLANVVTPLVLTISCVPLVISPAGADWMMAERGTIIACLMPLGKVVRYRSTVEEDEFDELRALSEAKWNSDSKSFHYIT